MLPALAGLLGKDKSWNSNWQEGSQCWDTLQRALQQNCSTQHYYPGTNKAATLPHIRNSFQVLFLRMLFATTQLIAAASKLLVPTNLYLANVSNATQHQPISSLHHEAKRATTNSELYWLSNPTQPLDVRISARFCAKHSLPFQILALCDCYFWQTPRDTSGGHRLPSALSRFSGQSRTRHLNRSHLSGLER